VGEMRNAYTILVGKPGRLKRRWEDNIKLVLRGEGWEGVS
jgi:hypothetical protein